MLGMGWICIFWPDTGSGKTLDSRINGRIFRVYTLHGFLRRMEDIKADGDIMEEYSIKETTLEQVFLSFARQQFTST